MTPRPRNNINNSHPEVARVFRCRICRGVHALRKCNRFLQLSAEKRLRAVLANRYCPNCLAHQHSGRSCRSTDTCRECQGEHHTLLHLDAADGPRRPTRTRGERTPRQSSTARQPRAATPAAPGVTLSSLIQMRRVSILPTATVLVDTGTKTFTVLVMLDPCSPLSRINASMATALGLAVARVGREWACSAVIRSPVAESTRLEVVLKTENQLQLRTPSRELPEGLKDSFASITLANDRFFKPNTISLVLGADVYGRIILPGTIPGTSKAPLAQNTIFGWVLSGSSSC